MAYSSGNKAAVGELVGWTLSGAVAVLSLLYFNEIKSFVGTTLGVPSAAEIAELQSRQRSGADSASKPSGAVELRAVRHGHFVTTAYLNGRPIEVMVDTGASMVALTYEDAESAGIFVRPSDFTHRVSTANGVAKVAPIHIDTVDIGDIRVRDVKGVVTERGAMKTTLLGMTFLGKLSKFEMQRDRLMLHE